MTVRIVLVSLAAIGCGTNGAGDAPDAGGAPDAGDTAVAFTRVEAIAAGKALASSIEAAAEMYGPVAPGATVAADCVTKSGDSADTDGDSIPASAMLTFDCSAKRLGYTGTLTGTESVSDTDPEAVAWAFTAGLDLHASLTGPFGGSMVVDTDGSAVATQGSLAGPFELMDTLDVVTVITNVRGIETNISENLDWTVSFAPDVDWTPGGLVVTGTLSTDGAWNVSVDQKSAEAGVSTPTSLTLSPSCDSRITAGLIEASFAIADQAASISVEWAGCGQRTVSYQP